MFLKGLVELNSMVYVEELQVFWNFCYMKYESVGIVVEIQGGQVEVSS